MCPKGELKKERFLRILRLVSDVYTRHSLHVVKQTNFPSTLTCARHSANATLCSNFSRVRMAYCKRLQRLSTFQGV